MSDVEIPARRQVAICNVCRARVWREPDAADPIPHESGCPVGQRDELRAVLAPLLDDPWLGQPGGWCCRGCGCLFDTTHVDHGHRADCPVNRRDALLGR